MPCDIQQDALGCPIEPVAVDGVVNAAKVYRPNLVQSTWFQHWAMQCGKCRRDFHRFAWFGKPRCPWCETVNSPNFSVRY